MLVGRIALQINFFSNPIFTNPQTSQVLNFPFQLFYEESKMRRKKSRICIILYCTNICLEKCYLKHSTFVFALQHLFEMRIYLVHLNYTNSQSYYVRANGRFFYTFFFVKFCVRMSYVPLTPAPTQKDSPPLDSLTFDGFLNILNWSRVGCKLWIFCWKLVPCWSFYAHF